MPFRTILNALLDNCGGAIAAAFLDGEGESIEVATRGVSREEGRVYGAYAGIFLTRAARIGESVLTDPTRRIKIDWERNISVLAEPLPEGYYVVLVLRRPFMEGVAVREIATARIALEQEI